METYLTRVTDYLLTQSWQIALLVVVVAAVSLVLRNKSAHVRYLLWLIVLAKCLVPPLLTVPVAILPQEKPAMVFEVVGTTISEPLELPSEPVKLTPAPIVRERPTKFTIRQWLGAGWIVGAIAFLVFNLLKALRASLWLWRQRKPLPAELLSDIEDLFSTHGIKNFPGVWQIDGISQPFVWGLLRGSIYLPADLLSLKNSKRCKSLLGHELSHIIRFDAAVNFLQVIVQAIFWFHPFVWWANRKIRAEREKCCDEMTIARLNASPRDYSTAIVETLVAKYESTRPVPSLAVAGPVKNIEERIKTMLRPGKKFYKRPSLIAATVALLLALLTVPTALVLTARAETDAIAEREDKPIREAFLHPPKSLHQAAADGEIEQVKSLISKGADINAKDERGWTALHEAAFKGQKEVAELLIAKGVDINAKAQPRWLGDRGDATALHIATIMGHKDVVELLIAKGADIFAKNNFGETPLDLAVRRYYLKRGDSKRRETVKLLIAKSPKPVKLHSAAYIGDIARIESLIKQGYDVNAKNSLVGRPLHAAAFGGHQEAIELLIDKGANVNAKDQKGMTPLHLAALAGYRDVVELLLDRGADVHAERYHAKRYHGATPLFETARHGHTNVAELLLVKGADVDARAFRGWTPLHRAVAQGHKDMAELLIAKGADVKARDSEGRTLLHRACWQWHCPTDIVEWLIAKGLDVNAKEDRLGMTPLYGAASVGNTDIVELLVAKGADVNAKTNDSMTTLHLASLAGNRNLVELLFAKGADVNVKTTDGKTALSLAQEKGRTEIVELLRKHGAKE